jgi:eukaryotic-like serine/threonine-protein kinase
LKVIRTSGNASVLARFAREAEAASTVHHPNVVAILDIDVGDHGELFIVMERVQGSTLEHERNRFGDSGWALPVLGQLADALAAIHRSGVVHRDLKPQNILINSDGVIKVADFGIAALRRQNHAASSHDDGVASSRPDDGVASSRPDDDGVASSRPDDSVASSRPDESVASPQPRRAATLTGSIPTRGERPSQLTRPLAAGSELTKTGTVMGSPLYMAPETWQGSKFATRQADMFSFGIIAYEVLSGTRPFDAPFEKGRAYRQPPALAGLCPMVPTHVSALVDACLLADPPGRPTAEALLEALDRYRATP